MELTVTPAYSDSQRSVWREVLIPHFTDDSVIVKLWCSQPTMQRLIVEQLINLTCHIRSAINPSHRYVHPPFLSQLSHLKHLRFLDPHYHRPGLGDLLPSCGVICQNIPMSVVMLDVSCLHLCQADVNLLLQFLINRPRVTVIPTISDRSVRWADHPYQKILLGLVSSITVGENGVVSHAQMHTFTAIHRDLVLKLKAVWLNTRDETKLWLKEHWCPHVRTVYFLGGLHTDRVLEQWCYSMFPNIERVENALTVPVTLKSYKNPSLLLPGVPSILESINTLPNLTSLHINVRGEVMPAVLPATLLECVILTTINRGDYQEILELLIRQLPAALVKFELCANIYGVSVIPGIRRSGTYWSSTMIANLPRSLKVLVSNKFPSDAESWKLLPPTLQSFDVYNLEYLQSLVPREGGRQPKIKAPADISYQVVSPDLTEIAGIVRSVLQVPGALLVTPAEDVPLQLSTLVRFQYLVKLELLVVDEHALATGCSSFPISLRTITLVLRYNKNVIDHISQLVFPAQLEKLEIKGDSEYSRIHGHLWHPLPNTLTTIRLYNLRIGSLPLQWPTQLAYLDLENSDDISDTIEEGSEALDSDSSSDDGDYKSYSLVVGSQLKRGKELLMLIPNIVPSLMNIPPKCIIYKGDAKGWDVFVDVDRDAHTFKLVVVAEADDNTRH